MDCSSGYHACITWPSVCLQCNSLTLGTGWEEWWADILNITDLLFKRYAGNSEFCPPKIHQTVENERSQKINETTGFCPFFFIIHFLTNLQGRVTVKKMNLDDFFYLPSLREGLLQIINLMNFESRIKFYCFYPGRGSGFNYSRNLV